MKTNFGSILFLAASIMHVAASPIFFQLNTPCVRSNLSSQINHSPPNSVRDNLVECVPTQLTWHGGAGAYFLSMQASGI
jgi:hypothetical protein